MNSELRYLYTERGYVLLRDGDHYLAGCHRFNRAEALAYWGPCYGEAQLSAVLDAEGSDARSHPVYHVRRQAARADRDAGRDLAWAREDPDARVRWQAAWADRDAKRDLAWAREDPDAGVRRVAAGADRDAGRRETA